MPWTELAQNILAGLGVLATPYAMIRVARIGKEPLRKRRNPLEEWRQLADEREEDVRNLRDRMDAIERREREREKEHQREVSILRAEIWLLRSHIGQLGLLLWEAGIEPPPAPDLPSFGRGGAS